MQGAGFAAEEGQSGSEIARAAAIGTGTGAAAGGLIGAVAGGIGGAIARGKTPEAILAKVTPDAKQYTPTQYNELVRKGLAVPKTATKRPQVILPQNQQRAALKFSELVDDDAAQTIINMSDQIGDLDDNVGVFLSKNKFTYDKKALRTTLTDALADIDDLTVNPERLAAKKETLVNNFLKKVADDDQVTTLWQARKEFDRSIESAFRGAPSVQKDLKIGFRNAVQDFIADNTDSAVYKGYMRDMSDIFSLMDSLERIAQTERGTSKLAQWAKDNPLTVKLLGGLGLAALGASLTGVGLRQASGSSSQ